MLLYIRRPHRLLRPQQIRFYSQKDEPGNTSIHRRLDQVLRKANENTFDALFPNHTHTHDLESDSRNLRQQKKKASKKSQKKNKKSNSKSNDIIASRLQKKDRIRSPKRKNFNTPNKAPISIRNEIRSFDDDKVLKLKDGSIYPLYRGKHSKLKFNEVTDPIQQYEYDTTPIYQPIDVEQEGETPPLAHNLSRVLFQHGPQFLQDPRSKVYNFDPYLQEIIPLKDFNMDLIPEYITSSKDSTMPSLCEKYNTKYYSSTSSMTGLLSQLHFFLSNFRPSYLGDFSNHIKHDFGAFTRGAKLPGTVIVRNMGEGKYAIDSDKSADREILLSQLGHVLEKLLTSKPQIFDQHRITNTETTPEPEKSIYQYARIGDFLSRSQLDCKDDRLPGNGTFDLKTRAVCAVRHDMIKNQYESTTGYEINRLIGEFESFEKELYELTKATLLKYSLQARIGNMDGIFIAYHNISRMFGFEYLPLTKIDKILHKFGLKNPELNVKNFELNPENAIESIELEDKLAEKWANDEFNVSMKILNDLLKLITTEFLPEKSFRMCFKAVPVGSFETRLDVIVSPVTDIQIEEIQSSGYKSNELILEELSVDVKEDVDVEAIEPEVKVEPETNLENEVAAETEKEVESEVKNETEPNSKSHKSQAKQQQQQHMDEHIAKLKDLNELTTRDSIGFQILVDHKMTNSPSRLRHPRYKNLQDNWTPSIKIKQMESSNHAQQLFLKYLNEKLELLSNNTIKDDDEVDGFIRILRAFGKKGEVKRSLEKDANEEKIWNKD